MRTAGQGQAAVPGERVRRRRKDSACLSRPTWAGGEDPTDCHDTVERYPDFPGLG